MKYGCWSTFIRRVSLVIVPMVLLLDLVPQVEASNPATPGLIAWWKLNSSSGITALDSAENSPGTLNTAATWVTGGILGGNAVSVGDSAFDDNGGSVSFPINLPPSFTLYFWSRATAYGSKLDAGGAYNNVILGGEVYLTNGFRAGFTPAGLFSFWTTQSGGTLTLYDTTDAPTGTWEQYAITYSAGLCTLYRNGSLVASASGTYVAGTTGMGMDSGVGGIDQFYGLVDQVRLYNYALSGSAITALYNSDLGPTPTATPTATAASTPTAIVTATPTSTQTATVTPPVKVSTATLAAAMMATPTPTPGLIGWWKLNSSSGITALDSAENSPGTLNTAATWVTGGILGGNAVSVGDSAFDDNGGSVSFPINLPPSFTLYFWSRATAYGSKLDASGAYNNIILGGEVYLTNGFRAGFTPAGLFSFWTTQSGGTLTLNDTTDAATGTWEQYAITYSAGIGTLYRNGSLVNSASGTYAPGTTGMGIATGVGGIDQFYGLVDQVRLYNYVLSGSAITTLYNSDAEPTPTASPTPTATSTATSTPTLTPISTSTQIPTPVPTPQPPAIATPTNLTSTLTLTSDNNGQTFSNYRISTAAGDCVDLNGATNVTFQNSDIGPCGGRGIYINGGSGNSVYDSYIHTEHASIACCDTFDGIFNSNSNGTTIQGDVIAYSESNIESLRGNNIVITGNFLLNPQGIFPRGQQIQVEGNNITVSDNFTVSTPDSTLGPAIGTSNSAQILYTQDSTSNRPSDNISFYEVQTGVAQSNYITGGLDANTPNSGGSQDPDGCGLIIDASNTTASSSITFLNNILVNTGQCGIGIASGTNHVVLGNQTINLNPNTGGNTADYIWNQYALACGPVLFKNNIGTEIQASGYASGYWNGGGCAPVTCDGTNANIDACNSFDYGTERNVYNSLTPIMVKLPPPLIPPVPRNCVAKSPYSTQTSLPPCT